MSTPIRLHYHVRGEGPPLVLIMGLGADGMVWEQHVETYARHFRCYLFDNRGVGHSPQPDGPYTTALMADDIACTLTAIGVARAPVAGISMGGAIAQELALRHPDLVAKLVLVSSWARCTAYMRAVFDHFAAVRRAVAAEDFTRLLQLWIWSPAYYETHGAALDAAAEAAGQIESPQSSAGFAGQCAACRNHDARDRLHEIMVPTLVTVGEVDIFTPLACSRELAEGISGARLSMYPGSGHVHHWEELARFNAETTAFLLES